MKVIEEDGVKWKVWEEDGRTYYQLVTPRAELNRLRSKGRIVAPWLRYHLEKMEQDGTLGEGPGELLLKLERRKGGPEAKIPVWWVVEKTTGPGWDRLKRDHPAWRRLEELSRMAKDELGLDVEISESDIKNAWRAYKGDRKFRR